MEPLTQKQAAQMIVNDFNGAIALMSRYKADLSSNPRNEVMENNYALLRKAHDCFFHVRDGHPIDTGLLGTLADFVRAEFLEQTARQMAAKNVAASK